MTLTFNAFSPTHFCEQPSISASHPKRSSDGRVEYSVGSCGGGGLIRMRIDRGSWQSYVASRWPAFQRRYLGGRSPEERACRVIGADKPGCIAGCVL
jgi:hypothetical protein